MLIIKYFILFLNLLSLEELEEIKNALNILKTKIKFTYEPIPEIFREISENTSKNVGNIFKQASQKMETTTANNAWEQSVEETETNLKLEDKNVIKKLSKLLGQTDVEGQVSQIEITENFLETQIKEAVQEKQKNEKLFTRLGTIMGLAIVIILL